MNTFTQAFPRKASAPEVSLQSISPQRIIQKILSTGRITTLERQWLQAATAELQWSATELAQLRLIHDRLRMGLIKIIESD